MTAEGSTLTGKLLIAMPNLNDPNFARTVVILCAHSDDGALGIIVNQPHPATMDDVIDQLDLDWMRLQKPVVYQGGPVSLERGFILYEKGLDFPGSLEVTPELFMGTNPDILKHLAESETSESFLFALGYAGWGAGQLEMELKENSWLVCDLDRRILFDLPPSERWQAAIDLLGIDLAKLVDTGGGFIN
ncbi:MAG: YqgE/AlgH family protein [Magnetococcales bacterium]|nr:YqgE/AlgH family protein [Magnetococcales bacterium]